MQITITGINGVPEIQVGDDLARLILRGFEASGFTPQVGDVMVVTQKVVSKAEGRIVDLRQIEPSEFARDYARKWGKDPRHIEVVLRESARIVRMDKGILISETKHGFVCANAGVDASNVPGEHIVSLLPEDSDVSAARIRQSLKDELGVDIPVIISDSFGRSWRNGIINIAIGASGLQTLLDYRGQYDPHGYLMSATVIAVADELASAAELVMGKVEACPVAVVRGYPYDSAQSTAHDLVIDPSRDMFR
ncbi:MAG: coenzyme F420-0:L-glutamate ligase [Chloroflexi bacterium]|nr:coenzyme F420-0:L-glutamate ligase [Chloroflexota bacterium]